MDQELNDLKVDIAIIKKDIKQIERFFDKVDVIIDDMSEVAKMIAVQQQLISNFDSKLNYTDEKLEEAKRQSVEGRMALKEQLDEFKQDFVSDMSNRVEAAHKDHANLAMELKLWNEKRHTQIIASFDTITDGISKRVSNLESYKWYIAGFASLGMLIMGAGHNLFDLIG